jgi:molybdenum cofactor cytidylyltransferase
MNKHVMDVPAIYAVVLAAGESRRFGSPKLLEYLDGETLVGRAALLARQCCGERSVLVTGHRAEDVAAAAGGRCAIILENRRYRDGLGTSIALAARSLASRADALLLLLADQPLIDVEHLRRLTETWSGAADEIVATAYAGTAGPPVLMPQDTFPALTRLRGDRGARSLLESGGHPLRLVNCEAAGVDVDDVADLEALRGRKR